MLWARSWPIRLRRCQRDSSALSAVTNALNRRTIGPVWESGPSARANRPIAAPSDGPSACKGDLAYDASANTLTCNACRLKYKVVDDIPVMLVDEAEKF